MDRICAVSGEHFEISAEDLTALQRLSPVVAGKSYDLPVPSVCPRERKRQRLAFRNERRLYRRKSDLSGRPIISVHHAASPYKVYHSDEWWTDSFDQLAYGKEYDFKRPFFEQFAELMLAVPRMALVTSPDAEENNCLYINFAGHSKNCYLTFDSDFNEDSCYTNVLKHSRSCFDCSYVHDSELCYECVDCDRCYQLAYSQDCSGCRSSYFLNSCIGCSDCLFCTNLANKQYWVRNKPHSKEEYMRIKASYDLDSRTALDRLRSEFCAFLENHPRRFCRMLRTENCSGDYVQNAKNCHFSFNIGECEDLRYCDSLYKAKDCLDVSSFGENIERVFNSGTIGIDCYNIFCSFACVISCSDLVYCESCRQAKESFGCCGLKRNQYCILNKQYSAEEYYRLVPRIISHMKQNGEWGLYFPYSASPFGYNETVADEFFPLDEDRARDLGAKWTAYPAESVQGMGTQTVVPDRITDVSDAVLSSAISCAVSAKPFRLTSAELEFYRRLKIPVPCKHPDARHLERMALRNPQELWQRRCTKTGAEILSSYAPGRPELVYCEEAYLEELQ